MNGIPESYEVQRHAWNRAHRQQAEAIAGAIAERLAAVADDLAWTVRRYEARRDWYAAHRAARLDRWPVTDGTQIGQTHTTT